jgi:hypothetical protein
MRTLFTLLALLNVDVPAELQRFIPEPMQALALESGDLNGDGRKDYILVLEDPDEEKQDVARTLLIVTREKDGSLKLAKRNDKVVLCRACGGIFGDPFDSVNIERGKFTVHHYGGSSWRWTADYTFAWSRRDQTWQLVRVAAESFHAGDPETVEKTVHVPPKHFGKIDLADFDPENYLSHVKP